MSHSPVIELLREAIAVKFHLSMNESNIIRIEEKQIQATCRFVEILLKKSMPYFGFSIDVPKEEGNSDPIYPFFEEKEGLCRKNDGILFFQSSNKIYVLLVELKSSNKGDYLKQLKAAKCLIEFIICRLNLLPEDPRINLEDIEFRGVLFSCRKTPNEGTTKKKNSMKYEDRNGLFVTENPGNKRYYSRQFLN